MVRQELNPKIFEVLKKKLDGRISESTIRPEITRIKANNPSLTLNASAEIYARKHGTTVHRYLDDKDRTSYGTIVREEVGGRQFNKVTSQSTRAKSVRQNHKEKIVVKEVAKMENLEEKWDAFICHASEDKEAIVRPLYTALTNAGLKVWYDESTLKLGDRLLSSIGKGIAKSGYGIVVLSESFFKKDWPQRELEGLAAKELEGQKVILPIWHKVDAKFLRTKSPILANVVAVSTNEGIESIVDKVLAVVAPKSTKDTLESTKSSGFAHQKKSEKSAKNTLQTTIEWLQFIDEDGLKNAIEEMEFDPLKDMFVDVLDAIALFDIYSSQDTKNIFFFIKEAILQRNKQEGAEIFEILLRWYFETAAPTCHTAILKILATLTRLSYLKEVVFRTKKTSEFVAEFGRSDSFDKAGINSEILQNIKTLLSDSDCSKIVDFALANGQINSSWSAKDYLIKLLPNCEGKANPEKLQKLYDVITK